MSTWHSKELGDGIMAAMPLDEIRDDFLRSFDAAGKPPAMAVFTRLESEGRLHCEVVAYFSPEAQALAQIFDAEPCEPPEPTGLGLLAGAENARSVLFPKSPP